MTTPLEQQHLLDNGFLVRSEVDAAGVSTVTYSDLDGIETAQITSDAIALLAAYDPLEDTKAIKIQEVKDEAVIRAQAFLDFINTFDALLYNREVFMSIVPGAISLTTNMQGVKDVTTAGVDARDSVNALGSVGAVEAYDVVNDPAWP